MHILKWQVRLFAFQSRILGLRYSIASYLLSWSKSCGPASDHWPHWTSSASQNPLSVFLHLLLSFHPWKSYQPREWRQKAMKICFHRSLAWKRSILISEGQKTYLRSKQVYVDIWQDKSLHASTFIPYHQMGMYQACWEGGWEDSVLLSQNARRHCPELFSDSRVHWSMTSSLQRV